MNVDHLNLLLSIKDVVAYSILRSLYEAAEEGSLIKRYLSDKEVLKSLRVFSKQPKSFQCVVKALDAKIDWLGRDLTLNILKKAWLIGSEALLDKFTDVIHYKYRYMEDEKKILLFNAVVDHYLWSGNDCFFATIPIKHISGTLISGECFSRILGLANFAQSDWRSKNFLKRVFQWYAQAQSELLSMIKTTEEMELISPFLELNSQYQEKRNDLGMPPFEKIIDSGDSESFEDGYYWDGY